MARPRIFGGKKRLPHRWGAQQVALPSIEDTVKPLHVKPDAWQEKVFKYADIVPEVQKGGKFVFNVMDRITFELERYDRLTNEWQKDDSPDVNAIERKINLAFKAGRAAQLGHLVEECFILVKRVEDNEFDFETLAPGEIRKKGKTGLEKKVMVDGDSSDVWVEVGDDVTCIRVYTPDAKDRHKANGPHKPLLNLLETMALELLSDQRNAISLLAGNGVFLVPTEIIPDEADTNDNSDTPGSRAKFENDLQEAMLLPITDGDRGEAVVPITLYGPSEHLKEVRHIVPKRGESAVETGERMERYRERYAANVDLPKEVILGGADSNHWNVWMVDANTWSYHLEPRGQQIANALYAGLVRSVMRNLGRDPDEMRLVPNAAAVIAKTDISNNAHKAYEKGAIEVEPYLEAIGFDAGDARPDAEELLLIQIEGPQQEADAVATTMPERTAAGGVKNPRSLLRQAARIANQHQARLEKLMRATLDRIAQDAARDGVRNAKQAEALTAETGQRTAADIPFLGYEPGKYFDKYADALETSTKTELSNYLRRIATLSGTDYAAIKQIWEVEFEARAAIVRQQAREFAESIASSSFDRGKAARVLNSQVRTLTSNANGGSAPVDTGAKNLNRPTHAGEDPVMRDALSDTEAGGSYATQYTWVVGDPMRPFEPHQELAGTTWYSWEEFDALDVSSEDSWLPGTVYFPGDHDGCQCSYEIDFVLREDTQ